MGDRPEPFLLRFLKSVGNFFEAPADFAREKIVVPNQQKYPWYHQKYRRVPTIDECYTDDMVCHFEANMQYQRDRNVDTEIISILRNRYEDCCLWNFDDRHLCEHLFETYEVAAADWMAKHGDLGPYPNVIDALMKQKHRMVWERRHGPVGTGMKTAQ
ncbi:hypothetical protein PV327_008124 [Microctonus hyperodae]|uniref:NADH dehydrogenase [ubiquinone] 1 beta subcomplex subunit 10 n=1 Tax=Microctonus hyperodae TaxID=165561 RepID=A0AA39F2G1_MICHY|nr:hypothetical protein PV327_008124 [Microctonus hyperodae]